MGKNTIGTRIVIEGEKEYRQALKNINTEHRELRSEMKLAQAEYSNNQNSIEALSKKYEILGKTVENQEKKIELYSQKLKQSQEAQEQAGGKVEELQRQLQSANEEMENMEKSSDVSKEALDKQKKVIEDLQKQLQLAETEYDKARNSTENWQTKINDSQADLIKLNEKLETTKEYLNEAEQSTDGCAKSIDNYGQKVDDAKEKTSIFGDVLKAELTSEVIIEGITKIANVIKDIADSAIETGASFEASMSQVAATMGMTTTEIASGSEAYNLLSNAAQECGKSTMFSATESAEALNYLALAGYDATKSAETLPKVLNLAAAGGLDLAYASDLVTDSMAALGLETSDLDKYIDQMARTSQKSNTSVTQLGEATLVCAGTANLTGQSLETLNAELGVLANNGIKGAEGGTHLRNILLSLSAPTDNAAVALHELNVNVSDSHGNMRDLNDIMIDLNKSMENMSSVEKTNMINKIFNKTDISAVNDLLKGTGEEFDLLKENIINSQGAAQDMANTLNDNLKGKVTILNSAMEGLGISTYNIFDKNMKKSVDAATESVGRLQKSIDSGKMNVSLNKLSDAMGDMLDNAIDLGEDALPILIDSLAWLLENADVIAGGVMGIVTANFAMNTALPAMEAVIGAWQAYKISNEEATVAQFLLNGAMEANPAGILVAAIGGLVGIVGALAINADKAQDNIGKLTEKVKEDNEYIKNGIEDRKKAADNTQAQASAAQNLTSKITALNEKEKLSNTEKARMKQYVEELNTIYPNLSLKINENTGKIDQNTLSIKANVEMEMQRAKVEALNERYADSIKDIAEAEADLAIVSDNLAQKEAELEDIQTKRKDLIEKSNQMVKEGLEPIADLEQQLSNLADQETNVSVEIDKLRDSQQNCIDVQGELQDEIDQYNRLLEKEKENTDEAKKAAEEAAEYYVEYKDKTYEVSEATQETIEKIDSLSQAYITAKEKAEESITDQVGLFDDLSNKSDLSTTQMVNNLNSQTAVFNQYAEDLQKASELVKKGLLDEGVLGAIQEMGIDGAGYMHELATATDTEVKSISDSFNEMKKAKDNLTSAMADIQTGYSDEMDKILGIQTDKMGTLNSQTQESYDEMTEIITTAGEDQVEVTEKNMEDVNTAIVENTEVIMTSVQDMCDTVVTAVNEKFDIVDGKSLVWYNIGAIIPHDMAQAVEDGTSEFVNAVDKMIQKAVDKAVEKAKQAAKSIDKALGSAMK